MKTPKCPYQIHDKLDEQTVWKTDSKAFFNKHEVLGQGWMCEQCASEWFVVESFTATATQDMVAYATYRKTVDENKRLKKRLKELGETTLND